MGRTNIVLDEQLVAEGLRRSGLRTKRELVRLALEQFVRRHRLKDLLTLRGKVRWTGDLRRMRRVRAWS